MDTEAVTAIAAENIRAILSARKMTQKELGEAVGMQPPDMSRLLKASRGVAWSTSLQTLTRIAAALEVPLADLISEREPLLTLGTVAAGPFDAPEVFRPPVVFTQKRYPAGCFALMVKGRSCSRFGVRDGDTVVVQPATEPQEGKLIVVRSAEGHTLKRFSRGKLWQYRPEDGDPVEVTLTESTGIAGVVLDVIQGERGGQADGELPETRSKPKRGKG
jgi:SOS-response transcriptional repressor LexA